MTVAHAAPLRRRPYRVPATVNDAKAVETSTYSGKK